MKDNIEKYERGLINLYKKEGLVALNDEDLYKGRNVFALFKMYSDSNSSHLSFCSIKNQMDIIDCNTNLRHFIGLLFYYRPYINNPLNEKFETNEGLVIYPYNQNLFDKRYCEFVTICYEKLYNFCDRIGDMLAFHTATLFPNEDQIYFSKVVKVLRQKSEYIDNIYLSRIIQYFDNEYVNMNKKRIEFVHYYQFDTSFRLNSAKQATNKDETENLWIQKRDIPIYFKRQLDLSSELLIDALEFINKMHLP